MKRINESLFPGDLKNLIKPIISIDEFESKIDSKAIVLAFYAREEDPAYDLSRFLEFGPIGSILDTEVSPAPDVDGFYLVFLEVDCKDKNQLLNIIKDTLNIVSYLTDIKEWTFSYRGKKGTIKLRK